VADEPNLDEFEGYDDAAELRRQLGRLQARVRRMRDQQADLVQAVFEGARDALTALGPVPKVPAPKADRRKKPEAALWHLTDWQGSKVTATYNTDVMRERIIRYCEKAARLTEIQRAAHPVEECHILFGGDMAEGLFNFPTQPFEIDGTLFAQFAAVARLEADVVRRALAIYRRVVVIQEWGNHGRLGNKRAVVPRADNLDRMIYELAREILRPEIENGRVVWEDSEEDIHPFVIGNYRGLLIHGDEIGRNGFASPTTIVKHVNQWKGGGLEHPFRDCYMGHFHNHQEWALADGLGAVYMTGSPESDNRYAGVTMASRSASTQRLHFVDPDRGRVTAQYKVELRDGD
jgi:hypothetical protein